MIPFFLFSFSNDAVTYEEVAGRFGDQIMGFVHAKWVSYKYGYRLLYKPFLYSEEFALHDLEERWEEEKERQFDHFIFCHDDRSFMPSGSKKILYYIPFFSDLEDDRQYRKDWATLSIDWKDPTFRRLLRTAFSPRNRAVSPKAVSQFSYLTVAVHIRRGGGKDNPASWVLWPMRFAPDSYYIEAFQTLCSLFPHRSILAHLFTDDLNPGEIAEKLKKNLGSLPITFSYREEGNDPEKNVTEDLFSMLDFDCLIRSLSNYSLIPSLIGDYKVIIAPKKGHWIIINGDRVEFYFDEIDVSIQGD